MVRQQKSRGAISVASVFTLLGVERDEEATTDICCRKEDKAATAKRTDEVNLGRYGS
ncbi:hypothetical protein EME01_59290 [Sinorhizobium meliloti]|nr:hypothetical protein EME01_59290 [Sinorhizobium meliloti]